MNMTEYRKLQDRVFAKLVGEGGLSADFTSLTASDQSYNLEMKQILNRILDDDKFADVLTAKIVGRYVENCRRRGIEESKYFDKVMTPYECCMLARYYGLMMLQDEYLSKDSRGR